MKTSKKTIASHVTLGIGLSLSHISHAHAYTLSGLPLLTGSILNSNSFNQLSNPSLKTAQEYAKLSSETLDTFLLNGINLTCRVDYIFNPGTSLFIQLQFSPDEFGSGFKNNQKGSVYKKFDPTPDGNALCSQHAKDPNGKLLCLRTSQSNDVFLEFLLENPTEKFSMIPLEEKGSYSAHRYALEGFIDSVTFANYGESASDSTVFEHYGAYAYGQCYLDKQEKEQKEVPFKSLKKIANKLSFGLLYKDLEKSSLQILDGYEIVSDFNINPPKNINEILFYYVENQGYFDVNGEQLPTDEDGLPLIDWR